MIVIDTNVVSEAMKPSADPSVLAWLDRQRLETIYVSSVTLGELLLGIELLPQGRRREGLAAALHQLAERLFGPRVLPFDRDAAVTYSTLVSKARRAGYSMPIADAQIAAVAHRNGFSVATRDTAPLLAAGIPVVNPWEPVKL